MVRELIWTESAYLDLDNIVEYISKDSRYYALVFYDDVMGKAQSLKKFPHRGRMVPEDGDPNTREIFIHRYRMIYHVSDDSVSILTIIHGARIYKETN